MYLILTVTLVGLGLLNVFLPRIEKNGHISSTFKKKNIIGTGISFLKKGIIIVTECSFL